MLRADVINLHLSTQWYFHSQYKSPRRWTYTHSGRDNLKVQLLFVKLYFNLRFYYFSIQLALKHYMNNGS